jgi:microcystin-dependent protein
MTVASRSRGVALLALSAAAALGATLVGPTRPARADDLVSFEISTAARAVQVFSDDGTGARTAEVEVPESTADLSAGPTGRAFSSIVWPGPIAGNLGTLLRVLQPSLPDSVTVLNDPVRAEATTGQDPPTSTFTLPNVSMSATASDELVEARATVGTVTGEAGPTNGFSTFGSARLRGGVPHGTGSASASGLSLAGGVVQIGAVTSTATATSDGVKGSGTASTEVVGLTIAGQRVAIDDKGLHVGASDTPLNAVVNQVVTQALAASGIELSIGVPTTTINGASATMIAPSLVITIKDANGVTGLVLGGARASVSGVVDDFVPVEAPTESTVAPSEAPGFGALPPGVSPSFPAPAIPIATTNAPDAPVVLERVPLIFDDSHRIRGAQVALALAAALLLAAGLGQLFRTTIGRSSELCPAASESP